MFNFIFSKKKLLIILFSFFILIVLFLLLQQQNKTGVPPITTVPLQPILDQDVKDLHWLNDKELAYTYFDSAIKQRSLAKTDGKKSVILLKDPKIKMSEIYWSKNNDLLIFDYGDPYQAYLYSRLGNLTKFSFTGYAFSWSPNGNSFFYIEIDENGQEFPKIYNIKDQSATPVDITPTLFHASFWSPNERDILLYSFDSEVGRGTLSVLNITTHEVKQITNKNIVFPAWSVLGDKIAYVTDGGLYISERGEEKLIYQTASNPQFISYQWLNNNEILLFDAEKAIPQLVKISTGAGTTTPILSSLNLHAMQRIIIAISPDQKSIAIASEKDGLWITPTP